MKNSIEDTYIEIPEVYSRRKLNALYREIPLKDMTFRLLRKYFNAMANLYGIIPLRKVWEIISDQSPKLVSKNEFFAFVEVARHKCEDYCIMKDTELYTDGEATGQLDWKIIDISLLYDNDDAFGEIDSGQEGKPYFIPPAAELLAYHDSSYCEPTPQVKRLRDFLTQTLHLDKTNADIAFDDILLYTRCLNLGLPAIIDELERFGADFDGNMLRDFAAIYQEFSNNTRMQCNRGYTLNELDAMMEPGDRLPRSFSFGPNIRRALADGTMDADELRQYLAGKRKFRRDHLGKRPSVLTQSCYNKRKALGEAGKCQENLIIN